MAAISPARDESTGYIAWAHSMLTDPWYVDYVVASKLIGPESEHQLYSIYACEHSSTPLVSDCRFQNFIHFMYLE